MTLLGQATEYVMWGLSVIPIQYRDKRPDVLALRRATGRDTWSEFQTRQAAPHELRAMFPSGMGNIAIVTGFNNIVVIDFDDLGTFWDWHMKYQLETYMVKTARGVHVYLWTENPGTCRKGRGVDYKAIGGYVLAPPSLHPSGWMYSVLMDMPILEVATVDQYLPGDLFPHEEPPKAAVSHPAAVLQPAADPWTRAAQVCGPQPGQDLISAIRGRFSLLDYLPGSKATSGDGRWYVTRCPFHDDHSPSMWVDTERGICGCYTCGGRPMDVINLLAALLKITNLEAITTLAGML